MSPLPSWPLHHIKRSTICYVTRWYRAWHIDIRFVCYHVLDAASRAGWRGGEGRGGGQFECSCQILCETGSNTLYLLCRSHVHRDKFRARVGFQDIFTVWAGVMLLDTGTDHRDIGQDIKTKPSSRDVLLYSAVHKSTVLVAYCVVFCWIITWLVQLIFMNN